LVVLDSEPVQSDYEIGTDQHPEIIGWWELMSEEGGRREAQKPRSKCAKLVVSFSRTPDGEWKWSGNLGI
jgi:hypothetical protein